MGTACAPLSNRRHATKLRLPVSRARNPHLSHVRPHPHHFAGVLRHERHDGPCGELIEAIDNPARIVALDHLHAGVMHAATSRIGRPALMPRTMLNAVARKGWRRASFARSPDGLPRARDLARRLPRPASGPLPFDARPCRLLVTPTFQQLRISGTARHGGQAGRQGHPCRPRPGWRLRPLSPLPLRLTGTMRRPRARCTSETRIRAT